MFPPLDAKTSTEAFESLCVRFRRLTLSDDGTPFIDLVFNGHLFRRDPRKSASLAEVGAWQVTLVGAMYPQIAALSSVYWELAQALGAILARPELLPPRSPVSVARPAGKVVPKCGRSRATRGSSSRSSPLP